MKILSVNQIREADKYTLENEPITSIDLMERASLAILEWLIKRFDSRFKIKVFCGIGNNGGDGLAVARLLYVINYNVEVYIVGSIDKASEEFKNNYSRLNNLKIAITHVNSINQIINEHSSKVILIDALFGSGLNKSLSGIYSDVVNQLNNLNGIKVAIDVPSGLYSDVLNEAGDIIFKADYTLTFQFPKLSFMYPENAINVGLFSVLDIRIHHTFINNIQTAINFVDRNLILTFLKNRASSSHKGHFGHALLMCGSIGKIGASVLSAKACMKSGVGLLTVNIPACGYSIIQTSVPEAMVIKDSNDNCITENITLNQYNVIGVGCGIGTDEKTQSVIKSMIQQCNAPLVFDADAINILALNKTWHGFIPPDSILTPHVKEFERLVGECKNSEERLKKQINFSISNKCYVILKGHHTCITTPQGNIYFNSTGNPGMATAGSGDVLMGIITSLMAQRYTPFEASLLGVYIHGLAGDIAAHELSQQGMTSIDIINYLPKAFNYLNNYNEN